MFVPQRLKTVVKREADLKMQKIANRFHKRGQDMYKRSVMTELLKEEERLKRQEERRLKDIEKVCLSRAKQQLTFPSDKYKHLTLLFSSIKQA